jgi:hypothetical protein
MAVLQQVTQVTGITHAQTGILSDPAGAEYRGGALPGRPLTRIKGVDERPVSLRTLPELGLR